MGEPSSQIAMEDSYPCLQCNELVILMQASQHPCLKNYRTIALTSDNKLSPLEGFNPVDAYNENIPQNNQHIELSCTEKGSGLTSSLATPDELLILEVQARPALWNISEKKLLGSQGTSQITKLWEEIYENLKGYFSSVHEMRKRWKGLYDTFKTNFKNYQNKRSGQAAEKKPKWKYFDMMSFLSEVDLSYNNLSESNMDTVTTETDNETQDNCEYQLDQPTRIDKRNSMKRKSQDVLEKIAESLNKPPQLQLPSIQWIPPPPPPNTPALRYEETNIDEIKSFAILIENKLRKMTADRANSTMFKIH